MQVLARAFFVLIVGSFLVRCTKTKTQNDNAEFLIGKNVAELTNDTLSEVSGIEASVQNPGMFWVHNDSGGYPEVFLIDSTLEIRLHITLQGIKNIDWEDIAVGPGPVAGKTYVYVGEIGDNRSRRKQKKIYRFEEPVLKTDTYMLLTKFDTITFQLPGKKKDSESLMIDPLTRDLYLFSKREKQVHLYKLPYPQSTDTIMIANDMATLPITQITSADVSADGCEILVKNYQYIYYWKRQPGESIDGVLHTKPTLLSYLQEPQGEAITWAFDGSGFYTLSETNNFERTYLLYYKRKQQQEKVLAGKE